MNEFNGRIIHAGVHTATQPDGTHVDIDLVSHPGGAAALAIDDNGRICLLKQFRPTIGAWVWEIPAGKLEADELPELTVKRELQEEAGITARHWQTLGSVLTCPGFSNEVVYLYLATQLSEVASSPEDEEFIEVYWKSVDELRAMIAADEITDAKTMAALTRYLISIS